LLKGGCPPLKKQVSREIPGICVGKKKNHADFCRDNWGVFLLGWYEKKLGWGHGKMKQCTFVTFCGGKDHPLGKKNDFVLKEGKPATGEEGLHK